MRVDVEQQAAGPVTIALSSPATEAPPLFPDLPLVHVESPAAARMTLTVPYSTAFLDEYGAQDERSLGIYRRDGDTLWAREDSHVDAARDEASTTVTGPGTWVLAPSWLLKAWQPRAIVGAEPRAGSHNVLVIPGWNASPWDACQLALMQALSSTYDRVSAYAYPSALDINESARWLRDELTRRYAGTTVDIVGFSEGGLVARAAIEPGAWNGGETIAAQVPRLITIATPHFGIIAGLPPSVLGDLAAAQMRPESTFLRELNAAPGPHPTHYYAIAGSGADAGASDGLVGVASALGRGMIAPSATVTLPLLHAATYGGGAGMPCDPSVYAAIAALR